MTDLRRFILIKHALPAIDPDKPPRTWPLSVEGRAASVKLAETLRPYRPNAVISSDESKAYETGIIAAITLGLPYFKVENLHEHDRTGEPYRRQEEFHAHVWQFFEQPSERVFGNETADEAHARFQDALRGVLARHRGNLAVVAHGTVISLLVSRLLGLEPFELWRKLGLPSAIVLDVDATLTGPAELIALHEEIR